MKDLDRLTTAPKFTDKINAAIEAVREAQELGVQAINESNLSKKEKDMAFAALGFDVSPSKPICVLNRPPISEEAQIRLSQNEQKKEKSIKYLNEKCPFCRGRIIKDTMLCEACNTGFSMAPQKNNISQRENEADKDSDSPWLQNAVRHLEG